MKIIDVAVTTERAAKVLEYVKELCEGDEAEIGATLSSALVILAARGDFNEVTGKVIESMQVARASFKRRACGCEGCVPPRSAQS